MNNYIKNKINEALYNFYLEADESVINDSLKNDIPNHDEYNKKKKQLIFLAKAKAKQQHNMNAKTQTLQLAGIKTIYLSYPMTNDTDGFIGSKMKQLEEWLVAASFNVFNPENLSKQVDYILDSQGKNPRYRDYMAFDLMSLCHHCDAILLADEWKQSQGCRCEAFTAHTCEIMMLDERLTQLQPSVVLYECFQTAK